MDAPQTDPTWIDFLKYSLSAMLASIAAGWRWADPKSGAFSAQLTIQAVATWLFFGEVTAAAQEKFHQPFWITGFFSAALSLVGLPLVTTVITTVFKLRFGIKNVDGSNDKPAS